MSQTDVQNEEWLDARSSTVNGMLPVTGAVITGTGGALPMAFLMLGGCWIHPHHYIGRGKWSAVTRDPQPLSRMFPEVTRRLPFDQRVQISLMFHAKTVTDRAQPDAGRSLGFAQSKPGSRTPWHISYNVDQRVSGLVTPDWWPSAGGDLPVVGAAILPNGRSVLYATPTKTRIYTSGALGENPRTICDTPPKTSSLCYDPATESVYFFTSPTVLHVARLTGTNHASYVLSPAVSQEIGMTWTDHPYTPGEVSRPRAPRPAMTIHSAEDFRGSSYPGFLHKPYSVHLLPGLDLSTGEVSKSVREDFATEVPDLPAAGPDGAGGTPYGPNGSAAPAAPVVEGSGGATVWPVRTEERRHFMLAVDVAPKKGDPARLVRRRHLIKDHGCDTAEVYDTVLYRIFDKTLLRSGRNSQNGGIEDLGWKIIANAAGGALRFASQSSDGRSIFAHNDSEVVRFNTVKKTSASLRQLKKGTEQHSMPFMHCAVSREGSLYGLTAKGVDVLARDEDGDYGWVRNILLPGGIKDGYIWWSVTGGRLIVLGSKSGGYSVFVIDPADPASVVEIVIASYSQGPVARHPKGGLMGPSPHIHPQWGCLDPSGRYLYSPVDFVLNPSIYRERFLLVVDLVAEAVVGRYRPAPFKPGAQFYPGDPAFTWYWV